MTRENVSVQTRSRGRRAEDKSMASSPRERRRPVAQTKAQAQSVVMAWLQVDDTQQARASSQADTGYSAAAGYSAAQQAKAKPTAASPKQAEQMTPPEPQGWSVERRKKQIPRSTDIEDADFIEIDLSSAKRG